MITEDNGPKNTDETVFKKLMNRRVPQITGVYLGASWGAVQFINWIVDRYLFSPHLVELTFVILISLLPSVVVIAYYHGTPGRNRWRPLEKVGIPMNILFTVLLVLFVFKGTDFGRISHKVTVQDETGQTIQREIPKAQYLKKIVLFYLDNPSGDTRLDWLQYGIINMLELDLSQDLFLDIISPAAVEILDHSHFVLEKIRDAGYKTATGLPRLFKRKICNEFKKDYFLSGKLNKENDDFIVDLSLFNAKDAKELASQSFRFKEANIFQQIDQMTVWIKKGLEIPAKQSETFSDLPLAEMFTASPAAARSYTQAINAVLFENDFVKAQKYFNQSLSQDPMFTMARLRLVDSYTKSNQSEKIPELYRSIMKELFKLPEQLQLYVKMGYYGIKGDMEKQIAVVRMIIKLYPRDITAYSLLAMFLEVGNKYDEAITQYKRILEIDPGRGKAIVAIGKLYQDKGDVEQALSTYQRYSRQYPDDPDGFSAIAQLYDKQRDIESAKSHYEKALLLKPDDINVLTKMAGIEARSGQLEEANRQYLEALKFSSSPRDKATVYESLAELCETRGQMRQSLEYTKLRLQQLKEYVSPFFVSVNTIFSVSAYIRAGEEQEAFRILDKLKQQLKPPQDSFVPLGYLIANLDLKNASAAEAQLPAVERMITNLGMKRLEFMLHRARGRIHQVKGNYSEAIENFRKGLELQPLDEGFMMGIGKCQRMLKQYGEAEEILLKLLKREPFSPKLNVELALLYQEKEDKENALKHIKIAVEIWKDADPNYNPALEARKVLEQLQ